MILIISTSEDFSTKSVLKWLIKFNQPFFVIKPNTLIDFKIIDGVYYISIESEPFFDLKRVKSVWYRRGFIKLSFFYVNNPNINNILIEERIHLEKFLYYLLSKKRHINKRSDNYINKLIVLDIANNVGLLTPISYYNTNNVKEKGMITKPIAGSASYIEDGKAFVSFTREIGRQEISKSYRYKYMQQHIDKKYELRIFYLNGRFWAMAIFSQKDPKTKVDFRIYNREKPNRNIPYTLPKIIEKKLEKLITKLKINCGSIDMIVTPKDEFYFLEINPVGQFGMTSFPCNYNLEKEIALYLAYGK